MKSKETLIALYQAGKLKIEDQIQLEAMLANNSLELADLGVEEEVFEQLFDAKELSDTQAMDERFYTFLEKEDTARQKTSILPMRFSRQQSLIAAAIGILLAFWGGWKIGASNVERASEATQHVLLSSMLDTEDVSERIHVISTHRVDEKLDKQVLDALLFSLIHDESNNVRLAAIEVLSQFSEEERVRESLIRSISHQESTIVLIEIAQALKQGGKEMPTEEFFTYIKKDIHPVLQKSLKEALKLI